MPPVEPKDTRTMPAGDARREQEAVNADALAEQAETRGLDVGRIDPRVFEIDNEIAQHFNELEVTNARPEYVYCWEFSGVRGTLVQAKLAKRVRTPDGHVVRTWEVVNGARDDKNFPEAHESIAVDNTRRIGDTILLRCRRDVHALIEQERARQRALRNDPNALDEKILEMQDFANRRGRGVIVRVGAEALADPCMHRAARHAAARGMARNEFNARVRDGRVPSLTPAAAAAAGRR